jgi:hypothetical protein
VGIDSDSEEEEESTSLLIHGDDTNDNDGAGDHLIMSEKSYSLTGNSHHVVHVALYICMHA